MDESGKRTSANHVGRPVESADKDGWRAAHPGAQTIWVDFETPQPIQEIKLRCEAPARRTQEFVLLCSTNGGQFYCEIVRQQFNFSSQGSAEDETYFPLLTGVTAVKLTIIPDISGGDACASLRALRLR